MRNAARAALFPPRLNEKGGKAHEMPAHHNLEAYLDGFSGKGTVREMPAEAA
jgi:hypothetical protein